jgi:enamine deaminase RidA (YjgF/YER057c/UK114 family)
MFEQRARELGIVFAEAPKPAASYVPAVRVGDLVYTSGMSSVQNGQRTFLGRVGAEVSLEEAVHASRLCVLNCLAAVRQLAGSLDQVKRIVRVTGYVRSADGFSEQHKVLNGASDFLEELFGEHGKHARSAIGVNELPFGISVEVELIVEMHPVEKENGR